MTNAGPSLRVLPVTDLDIARCFAEKFKGKLYHVHAWKSWVSWDGTRWARDPDEKIVRCAMSLADDYEQEAREESIPDRRAKLFKMAGHLSKGKTIREMIALGRAIMPKASEDFDQNPNLLNTPMGTVDLKDADHYDNYALDDLTKSTGVAYDTDTACPEWQRFLFKIFAGNTALIDFVQRAVGYSLTGHTRERVAFVLHGEGRNGKSTFLETIQAALGDYATTASSNVIMAGRDEKTYNDLAALRGVRFVAASESKKGRAIDTGIFKLVTGNETISARFLYGEWFTFKPQFKLWLATNHLPEIDADDQAVWDRIRPIPFLVRFCKPGETTDPELIEDQGLAKRLEAELPGILAWAVQGAALWWRDGLGTVEAVSRAALNWRHDADVLGQWLDEACEQSALHTYRTGLLYESFRSYAKSVAPTLFSMRQNEFVEAMQRKGFKRVVKHGNRSFMEGVSLRQEQNERSEREE